MTRVSNHFLVLALFLFLAAGCQSTTGETAKEHATDATITSAVKAKLAGERMSTLARVEVDTVRSTVYLTGVVPTVEEKNRAGEVAKSVSGVNNVVNNLQVRADPR